MAKVAQIGYLGGLNWDWSFLYKTHSRPHIRRRPMTDSGGSPLRVPYNKRASLDTYRLHIWLLNSFDTIRIAVVEALLSPPDYFSGRV